MTMLVYKYSGIMTVEMMFECCDKQFKNFRNKAKLGTNLALKNTPFFSVCYTEIPSEPCRSLVFTDTVNPEPRL